MVKWRVTKCKWTDLVAHLSHPQGPPLCFHLIHIALCSALQCKSVTGCGNLVYCICAFWGQLKKCYRCTNNRNKMFILVSLWIKLISYSHKGHLNVDLTLLICLSVFEVNFGLDNQIRACWFSSGSTGEKKVQVCNFCVVGVCLTQKTSCHHALELRFTEYFPS